VWRCACSGHLCFGRWLVLGGRGRGRMIVYVTSPFVGLVFAGVWACAHACAGASLGACVHVLYTCGYSCVCPCHPAQEQRVCACPCAWLSVCPFHCACPRGCTAAVSPAQLTCSAHAAARGAAQAQRGRPGAQQGLLWLSHAAVALTCCCRAGLRRPSRCSTSR